MKDLNEYGRDVMNAQSHLEGIDANIASTESALSSLKDDREVAVKSFENAKQALQEATDRIKAGDYGVAETGTVFEFSEAHGGDDAVFEGLNRTPPDDDPDFQIPENRSHAGNGAGF